MLRKKTGKYIFIIILIFSLIFPSCATLNTRFDPPTIHVVNIEVKEIKLLEAVFDVQLRVLNPNETALITKGINCDLEINDIHLASGVSNATTEIPAFGSAIVPMEIYSSALAVLRNVIVISDQKTFRYKIKGRIKFGGNAFMLPYIHFESEGDLDIQDLMEGE